MSRFNKQKTIKNIAHEFNERQSHDSYYFEDSGTDIIWNRDREVYLILKKDRTWNYSSPGNLIIYIENLTTKDLKEYFEDWMCCEYSDNA